MQVMIEKYKQGPVGMMTVFPSGPPVMPKFLGMWFVYCLIIGFFVAYLTGRTVTPQLGGQATDFVLLVMNDRGANGILSSKVKIGADASAAAGPVGRNASAETDVTMRAEIFSYSRARGLFAGISLEGSTIRPDNDANERIYARKIPAKEIALSGTIAIPEAAQQLISTLNAKTPKHKP